MGVNINVKKESKKPISVNPNCTVTDNWLGSTHVSVIVGKRYFILNISPSTAAEDTLNNGEARTQ
jgi:hypothetical protein